MNDHIVNILETTDKLKSICEEINDALILALTFCSLSLSNDELITALEARPEVELTPEFMRNIVMDKFNKRIENLNFPSDPATKDLLLKARKKNANYAVKENVANFNVNITVKEAISKYFAAFTVNITENLQKFDYKSTTS